MWSNNRIICITSKILVLHLSDTEFMQKRKMKITVGQENYSEITLWINVQCSLLGLKIKWHDLIPSVRNMQLIVQLNERKLEKNTD